MNAIIKNKILPNNPEIESIKLSGKIVNPKRDWMILMILSAILIISSIGFDEYMRRQIESGDMYVSVNKSDLVIENLQTTALQNILTNFENKKTNMMNLKLENLVDPSI